MIKSWKICAALVCLAAFPAPAGNRPPLTAIVYRLTPGENLDAIGVYVERIFNERYSILKKRPLDEEGISLFRKELQPIVSSNLSDNFCGHEPGFAVIMFRDTVVIYDASYCFKCDTIGKATKTGWKRLAMSGSEQNKVRAKAYLLSLFNESPPILNDTQHTR